MVSSELLSDPIRVIGLSLVSLEIDVVVVLFCFEKVRRRFLGLLIAICVLENVIPKDGRPTIKRRFGGVSTKTSA